MDVFHYIKKTTQRALPMVLAFYCLLTSLTALAEDVRLEVVAQLPSLSAENKITVIALPNERDNKHRYLIADEAGELSLLNDATLTSLARLPLNNHSTDKQVKLTTLTLHPSFALADKAGYQRFFTAHIEPAKTNNNVARLTLLADPVALPFDAVITQWQYDSTAQNKINVQQRREVIRIAVPTATHQIQKIAFNPYNKVWHDDYGLMHVALSDSSRLPNINKAALYSGVVLRINPEKFGLRNYRVPSSNPFVKTNDVNNEIFILGAQKIRSFSWSKQHYGALLVEHDYDGDHQVVVAGKGADWRESYQKNLVFPLKSTQGSSENILPYYGRNLKASVGSILYLINNTKNWQLAQLNTTRENSETKNGTAALPILSFSSNELSPKNNVSLLFDHSGEPLLLDLTSKQLLSVTAIPLKTDNSKNIKADNKNDEQTSPVNSNAYSKLLLTLLILVIAVVFYLLRPKKINKKAKLRSQFARFELDSSQTAVLFYKRHQSEIDSQLAIDDIAKSEILINDSNVSIINKDIDHGYSEQYENQLRLSFNQAHRHKLINDETRQVQLYLTDKNAKIYVVCLYLREGNQRLTKTKYFDTLESLIDWSWFIAKQLNPDATATRPIQVTVVKSAIKKVTKKAKNKPDAIEIPVIEEPLPNKQTAAALHDIVVHDSELINALDKLVDLKQQGFLTDEEFSLAKAKILSDMTV
ncbi:SHOCT domain-containing protein [Colwellia hornerae]|uniref:SHOCT domain-containing protein n=1 Tax=Colwellia hornerae TaxID=89402 RepID=A0A5C6Q9I1_9GAMM|nr:SHOCT domain-containing protein [Colwellia hornerae]TWX51056.1 SHOCT domain-containing protein [Colwellia hornerae]TWX56734.1 SHOCT domain-containing protein [Colwellia hornerae]TWX65704.1 SHOCT domain-containing protein [Colwellia hornerae]